MTSPQTIPPPSDSHAPPPRVLGLIVADLDRAAIGTRSRLRDPFGTAAVLPQVVARLLQVRGTGEVVILAPAAHIFEIWQLLGPLDRVQVKELAPRPPAIDARVRTGRAWNLLAWRGGAGQWTAFDEEYHPAAFARAAAEAFAGAGAEHILIVHSHAIFLNIELTSALVHHHLHKNHEMRVTYTPAAPGLSGMLLRADIVLEMGEKQVMPCQLLGYDPKQPIFDTLIREACMQVDPALSKIPNRFCVDTDRSWELCIGLAARPFASTADLCLAAARSVAPGITDLSRTSPSPREVEIELTTQTARAIDPAGISHFGTSPNPAQPRPAADWTAWLSQQHFPDDLLLTFAGHGDPLLYPSGLLEILRAARRRQPLSICLQTDLAGGDIDALLTAIGENLVDVISVTMYGHTPDTYAQVAGANLHAAVMHNMERLAEATRARAGMPLVIPRLLKVRQTIPELEPFFDFWIDRCGWAVIDSPTDFAGSADFRAVVDMAPPKRKPCRRLWDRMLIRADGRACPCDQDAFGKLAVGSITHMSIPQMWTSLQKLRDKHSAGQWNEIDPCKTCREWHRA